MDSNIILVFKAAQPAAICLSVIDQLAAAYWIEQGYTVNIVDGKPVLIGKNALTGDDNPEGITTTWDEVKESPDGRFYFTDPATKKEFSLWQERATAAGYVFDGEVMEFPQEWIIEPNHSGDR